MFRTQDESIQPARVDPKASARTPTGRHRRANRRVAKRTLTSDNMLRTVANCAIAFPVIVRSIFRPKTSKALREKVMLGVTAINDCRYLRMGSFALGDLAGHPTGRGQPDPRQSRMTRCKANDPAEAAAILFGQHYAEHLDQIDPDSLMNLRNHFSQAQVREILAYVYFITFTNLSGNTVDVVLERVRGKGRPDHRRRGRRRSRSRPGPACSGRCS